MTIKVPVGTGPFMLASYSSSLIKWKPNPNYWGGTPPESEIDTPSIATNAAASDALVSGQLDWAGNDIPNVYANYVNLNPLTNHAWFAAGSTVTLWFNLNPGNGGATGIGDVAVRKAVSYGVDRNALAQLGESGYEQPASSSSALILPNQAAFLPSDGTYKNDLSISGSVPDAATAKADNLPTGDDVYDILTAGGWTPPASSRTTTPAPGPSSRAETATAAATPTAGPRAARSSSSRSMTQFRSPTTGKTRPSCHRSSSRWAWT